MQKFSVTRLGCWLILIFVVPIIGMLLFVLSPLVIHRNSDPVFVVLAEEPGVAPGELPYAQRIEYWVSVKGMPDVTAAGRMVEAACSAVERTAGAATPPPERIYNVYALPGLRQHQWNIETDEPNFVYRCIDGELTVLVQHDGIYRDSENRLMPAEWRPPRPKRGLYSELWSIVVFVLVVLTYVLAAWSIGTQWERYLSRRHERR